MRFKQKEGRYPKTKVYGWVAAFIEMRIGKKGVECSGFLRVSVPL